MLLIGNLQNYKILSSAYEKVIDKKKEFLNRSLRKFLKIILVLIKTFMCTLNVLFKFEQIKQN